MYLISKIPFILHTTEYIVGINGNKPAKSFNPTERGKDRYKYCRRKKFWSMVEKLMDNGLTSHEAISRLEMVYARNNATIFQTLMQIGKDKNLTLSIIKQRFVEKDVLQKYVHLAYFVVVKF